MGSRTTDVELRPISEDLQDGRNYKANANLLSDPIPTQTNLQKATLSTIPLSTASSAGQEVGLLKISSVVGFYIFASISMIMINKAVLNQAGLPISFLWGQLVIAALILKLACIFQVITLPPLSFSLLKSIAPLIAINVVGLIMNTLCLHNIDAVLYQVARSLILPMTVAMSPLMGQRISMSTIFCCLFISMGFVIGIFGEGTISISTYGIVFGVLSSFTTALHSFVIKNSFSSVKHNGAFDLVYLNNLFSAMFLAPLLILEWPALSTFAATGGWPVVKKFIIGTLIAGLAGLLINFAGFLQIKVTSPVTHTVSSAARGVLQTIAANAFLGEAITMARCIGIAVTLTGSCAYSLVKTRENSTKVEYTKVAEERSSSNRN